MLDTYRMFTQLRETLDERAASTITELLSSIYQDLQQTVTRSDFAELKGIVAELGQAQKQTETQVKELTEEMRQHRDQIGGIQGQALEAALDRKPDAYFGMLVRCPRVTRVSDLLTELEARLTEHEIDDLMLVDLLVTGRLKGADSGRDVYVAVEASRTVDDHDLDRVLRRAGLLRKAGYAALPLTAGIHAHPAVVERANQSGIGVLVGHELHNRAACLRGVT